MAEDDKSKGIPTHEMRQRDGKKGILFTIEVTYHSGDHLQELKRRLIKNMYWHECDQFRYQVFDIGFMINISPGEFQVINPKHVHEVWFHRQNGYFSV